MGAGPEAMKSSARDWNWRRTRRNAKPGARGRRPEARADAAAAEAPRWYRAADDGASNDYRRYDDDRRSHNNRLLNDHQGAGNCSTSMMSPAGALRAGRGGCRNKRQDQCTDDQQTSRFHLVLLSNSSASEHDTNGL
jgi:hypothetical protein